MERLLLLSNAASWQADLAAVLTRAGHEVQTCRIASISGDTLHLAPQTAVVVDLREESGPGALIGRVRHAIGDVSIQLMAVLNPSQLERLDFSIGFDDFLVAPFDTDQVIARVRQLRWRENHTETTDLLKAGDLLINLASCEVTLQGMPLSLTYQEYELLRYLVEHRGRVFTREQLLSELWGYDYYGGTRTVDVHIRRLRAKLGTDFEEMIQTVRNVGYRFSRES